MFSSLFFAFSYYRFPLTLNWYGPELWPVTSDTWPVINFCLPRPVKDPNCYKIMSFQPVQDPTREIFLSFLTCERPELLEFLPSVTCYKPDLFIKTPTRPGLDEK